MCRITLSVHQAAPVFDSERKHRYSLDTHNTETSTLELELESAIKPENHYGAILTSVMAWFD
jgi:hypothetical protein